jgi:hypothetical protein
MDADSQRPFRDHFADTESFRKEGVGLAVVLKMKLNTAFLLLK